MRIKDKYKFFTFLIIVFLVFQILFLLFTRETKIIKIKEIKIKEQIKYQEKIKYKNRKDTINAAAIFEWYPYLKKQCEKRNVDTKLMMAVYKGESEFKPKLINPSSGASGLGQITEETYNDIHYSYFKNDGTTFKDMLNPYTNIKYTVVRMRMALDDTNSKMAALHSYGGCVSQNKKDIYIRYINKQYKSLYFDKYM